MGPQRAKAVVRWLLEGVKRDEFVMYWKRFWKEHIKAELEITSDCANQPECALKTLTMSCEPAEYFKLFHGGADRGPLNASGSCSQYWHFALCYWWILCHEQCSVGIGLGLCYFLRFSCENISLLVQQQSVPLQLQSKELARSLSRFSCCGPSEMPALLFASIWAGQCSHGHVTPGFPAWKNKKILDVFLIAFPF